MNCHIHASSVTADNGHTLHFLEYTSVSHLRSQLHAHCSWIIWRELLDYMRATWLCASL